MFYKSLPLDLFVSAPDIAAMLNNMAAMSQTWIMYSMYLGEKLLYLQLLSQQNCDLLDKQKGVQTCQK